MGDLDFGVNEEVMLSLPSGEVEPSIHLYTIEMKGVKRSVIRVLSDDSLRTVRTSRLLKEEEPLLNITKVVMAIGWGVLLSIFLLLLFKGVGILFSLASSR